MILFGKLMTFRKILRGLFYTILVIVLYPFFLFDHFISGFSVASAIVGIVLANILGENAFWITWLICMFIIHLVLLFCVDGNNDSGGSDGDDSGPDTPQPNKPRGKKKRKVKKIFDRTAKKFPHLWN